MKSLKLIALILSMLCIFCSCENKSVRKARLMKLYYSSSAASYKPIDSTIYIMYVDTAHKVGDDVIADYLHYKIVD